MPKAKAPLLDTRVIYCGDNLEQLKKLPDTCVDLIYIDPPFNSNRNYEVFWGEQKEKRSFADRHESTQAYLDFMRPRCEQLHRVLKDTGSFYFHCDWHASHYVKVMLDGIFGENNFQSEITWKRTSAHGNASVRYADVKDSIFFYTAGDKFTFNMQFVEYSEEYLTKFYRFQDERGRYRLSDLRNPSVRPNLTYDYKGYKPHPNGWAMSLEKMEQLDRENRLHFPASKDGRIQLKRYLHEMKGVQVSNLWDDIQPIQASAAERLGYPTQKPLALLERIIQASSNEGDIVLDAFCGCGTALEAAQHLKRQWIGIDVSPTACRVMAQRLKQNTTLQEDEDLWKAGNGFIVRNTAWTETKLREVPPFEFENWAVFALGGKPNRVKVGDMGIDGRIFPVHALPGERGAATGELAFTNVWFPIQVKQKDKVGRPDIDQFEAVMIREKRTLGYFVGFDFSKDARDEISAFQTRQGLTIKPLTVRELLEN